jgi:hypothetical protein
MSDDSTTTIRAIFAAREAADLAVEHLVQQHGIDRSDVFVEASSSTNSAGTTASGGDLSHGAGNRQDARLQGEIEVSADIRSSMTTTVRKTFEDAGAIRILAH